MGYFGLNSHAEAGITKNNLELFLLIFFNESNTDDTAVVSSNEIFPDGVLLSWFPRRPMAPRAPPLPGIEDVDGHPQYGRRQLR